MIQTCLLSEDLLWMIFMMNADPNDSHTFNQLTTARWCSQVCQQWRAVSLGSCSLWARLINLDHLKGSRIMWKEEVLSRTGDTRLWIRGTLSPCIRPFFLLILSRTRRRIERLEINEQHDFHPHKHDREKFWGDFLRLPWPNLRILTVNGYDSMNEFNLPFTLFNNDAPMLEIFKFRGLRYPVSPFPSCLSTVRNVGPLKLTLPEAFAVLRQIPRLENVELDFLPEEHRDWRTTVALVESDAACKSLSLPLLRNLRLVGDFLRWAPLLIHINPSYGCGLSLSMGIYKQVDPVAQAALLDTIQRRIVGYMQAYFDLYPPAILNFSCNDKKIRFNDDGSHFQNCSVCFSIQLVLHSFDCPILEELATNTYFAGVQRLVLDLRRIYENINLITTLTSLPSKFISLVSLETNEDTLQFLLHNYQENSLPSFPALQILKLNTLKLVVKDRRPIFFQYLCHRRDIGLPIAVLDLSKWTPTFLYDLQALEEHHDLVIKWTSNTDFKIVEYRCGSGSPEKLGFNGVPFFTREDSLHSHGLFSW